MVSGYGVELAVKSTEYKAVDDQKVKDEKKSEKIGKDEDVGEDEVEGFLFQRLRFEIKILCQQRFLSPIKDSYEKKMSLFFKHLTTT